MEAISVRTKRIAFVWGIIPILFLFGCSTLGDKNPEEVVKNNEEFDEMVDVQPIESQSSPENSPVVSEELPKSSVPPKVKKAPVVKKSPSKVKKKPSKIIAKKLPNKSIVKTPKKDSEKITKESQPKSSKKKSPKRMRRQPILEGDFPYVSRRPPLDPFRPGERVIHKVSYFGVEAGHMYLDVQPFVEVNGKKSYSFSLSLVSSRVFSMFYSVDDKVTTYVDYESLVPSTYHLKVKESGQIKDSRAFFDHQKLFARFWMKKWTKKKGHEKLKKEWEILPYSQNVFSAVFYMRTMPFQVGKTYSFRVANDGKNIIFKAKVVGTEKLNTEAGEFDTLVLKPTIEVDGIFKPVGEIKLWLSNDDRKYLIRLESDIKIGTLVFEATKIIPGT